MRTSRSRLGLLAAVVVAVIVTGIAWGAPGDPLTMDLVVDHTVRVGDKTTYFLKATAAGGAPPYYFTWENATPNAGITVNPNTAVRTCLNTQTVTVKVKFTLAPWIYDTVTIGGGDR